jgi:hypothetical protein
MAGTGGEEEVGSGGPGEHLQPFRQVSWNDEIRGEFDAVAGRREVGPEGWVKWYRGGSFVGDDRCGRGGLLVMCFTWNI